MTKKELIEENKLYKKQLNFVRKAILCISMTLLIISAFLMGLCW